ncbi:MAG: heme-binding protein, partial [Nitrospira sp.]|nr:heme-binding protein [Nitrospira sp.]
AYTAASLRRPTTELAELINKVPTLQVLREMNDQVIILGGGLPIEIAGEVVGGIGVGGAPGAHLDDACAQAGLDAIGAAPKVPAVK